MPSLSNRSLSYKRYLQSGGKKRTHNKDNKDNKDNKEPNKEPNKDKDKEPTKKATEEPKITPKTKEPRKSKKVTKTISLTPKGKTFSRGMSSSKKSDSQTSDKVDITTLQSQLDALNNLDITTSFVPKPTSSKPNPSKPNPSKPKPSKKTNVKKTDDKKTDVKKTDVKKTDVKKTNDTPPNKRDNEMSESTGKGPKKSSGTGHKPKRHKHRTKKPNRTAKITNKSKTKKELKEIEDKLEEKISRIRKKSPEEIMTTLEKQGFKVSGKSQSLLRDLCLYSEMSNIVVSHE